MGNIKSEELDNLDQFFKSIILNILMEMESNDDLDYAVCRAKGIYHFLDVMQITTINEEIFQQLINSSPILDKINVTLLDHQKINFSDEQIGALKQRYKDLLINGIQYCNSANIEKKFWFTDLNPAFIIAKNMAYTMNIMNIKEFGVRYYINLFYSIIEELQKEHLYEH